MVKYGVISNYGEKSREISLEEGQMYKMGGNYIRLNTEIDKFMMAEWNSGYTMVTCDLSEVANWWRNAALETLKVVDWATWNEFKQVCKDNAVSLEN
jgi:hypothetical protein